MNRDEIIANLPPLHQQIVVTLLGCVAIYWIMRKVRYHRVHEAHALLWLAGIGGGIFVIWCRPLLVGITSAMGVGMPASSLLLLAVFFLFLVSVWLTSMVSFQQDRISRLIIEVSILKSKLKDLAPPRHEGPLD